MAKEYLLGIDIGTSSCKVALFDFLGAAHAQASVDYPVQYPHPHWAQQDPQAWWRAVCDALRTLREAGQLHAEAIRGIGVAGQSWSAIAVDAQGNALTPTPIWTDTRAQAICEELLTDIPEAEIFALCGNPLRPSYTLPKVLWYQRHLPDVYARAATILQSNSFIVHRLTGMFTQDVSQGYGYACFDMHNARWDVPMCERLGMRPSLLPPIHACHEVVGRVTREAAAQTGLREGTPVVAGGLDAACGTLGAGVVAPGQAQEQGGQAGGMSLCTGQYAADPRLILSAHVVPGRWLLQGGTTGGGGALRWLRETICPELSFADMSGLASTVAAGSEGLLFLPYMAGERSPIWNPYAKGVFLGLDYSKSRAHLIRAVMEGVAYSLRHNLAVAGESGARVDTLRAMGGSAGSLVWTQIKADVTGHVLEVPGGDTATTLGAALLAGMGTGVYGSFDDAVGQTVAVGRVHTPNPAMQAAYDAGYARYREAYARLAPMMTS